MFTGIIQKVGEVLEADRKPDALLIQVRSGFTEVELGESIAVNGVCLTVTEFTSEGDLRFYLSRETLDRSNLRDLSRGTRVNLERAMRASDRLSGHIVQGHVDGIATLTRIAPQAESYLIEVELPPELVRYCVEKGSISLNGTSLTINHFVAGVPGSGRKIGITLIPHTWENTSFSSLSVGAPLNVEVDVLAKYVEQLCQPYRKP